MASAFNHSSQNFQDSIQQCDSSFTEQVCRMYAQVLPNECNFQIRAFYDSLARISAEAGEQQLSGLAYRLDFNDYYSAKVRRSRPSARSPLRRIPKYPDARRLPHCVL